MEMKKSTLYLGVILLVLIVGGFFYFKGGSSVMNGNVVSKVVEPPSTGSTKSYCYTWEEEASLKSVRISTSSSGGGRSFQLQSSEVAFRILIGVGMSRGEDGRLHGDYEENEIGDIASYYTPTPGGVGPLNIACLMQNLLKACPN